MTSLGSFQGVALITGAGSGLGRASAIAFAQAGSKLILVDVSERGLEETKKQLDIPSERVYLKVLNLTDRKATNDFIRSILTLDGFHRIDYAINAAGIVPKRDVPIAETDADEEEVVLDVNLISQYHLLREEIKVMLAQEQPQGQSSLAENEPWRRNKPACRGSVVLFSSWSSQHGSSMGKPAAPSYPVSKHGIAGLTKSAAVGHAAQGIRVNAVAPGPTATPILGNARPEVLEQFGQQYVPQRRIGLPGEVADLVLFLCSERATYINGETSTPSFFFNVRVLKSRLVFIDGALNAA